MDYNSWKFRCARYCVAVICENEGKYAKREKYLRKGLHLYIRNCKMDIVVILIRMSKTKAFIYREERKRKGIEQDA
jgi:hypothetical protein